MAATARPDYDLGTGTGIFAPARTWAPIINRLNHGMARVLHRADVKEKFISLEMEAASTSPKEFAAAIRADMAKVSRIMKDTGIRAD